MACLPSDISISGVFSLVAMILRMLFFLVLTVSPHC